MVLVKRICPPERRKAVVYASASPSTPELSISKPSEFKFVISLGIAWSSQPETSTTISTKGTVFAQPTPNSTLDTLARGTAYLVSTADPTRRISLGNFRTNNLSGHGGAVSQSADLKERSPNHLLTIPSNGEIQVTQQLGLDRLFQYEQSLKPQDVVGEEWQLGLQDGYIGTTWWCWGDLDGDLRAKKLSAWHEGMRAGGSTQRPSTEDVDEGSWITGCNPIELVFEDRTSHAVFRFVE